MKIINSKSLINTILLSFVILFAVSCNNNDPIEKPKSNPEPIIKGTINVVNKIEVITHYGHLHASSFHANAQPEGSPFLRKQVLILERNKDNTWKQVSFNGKNISESNNTFIVEGESSEKDIEENLGGRYSFEFIYYNKAGERINNIFSNESSKYQTFLSIDSYTNNTSKKKTTLNDAGVGIFSYRYRDTNPEHQMYKRGSNVKLANNNLGLKGYLALKKSRISFNLTINLVKFKDTYTKSSSPIFKNIKDTDIDEQITFNLPVNIITHHPMTDAEAEIRYKELGDYFGISTEKMENLEWGDVDPESSQYWM